MASHLMFMGAFGTDLGLFGTSFMYAFRDRETIQDFFEEITGERMMYNYFRPGGVAWDVPEDFSESGAPQVLKKVRSGIDDLDGLIMRQRGHPRPLPRPGRDDSGGRDRLGPQRADAAGDRAASTTSAERSRTRSTTASSSIFPWARTATSTTGCSCAWKR